MTIEIAVSLRILPFEEGLLARVEILDFSATYSSHLPDNFGRAVPFTTPCVSSIHSSRSLSTLARLYTRDIRDSALLEVMIRDRRKGFDDDETRRRKAHPCGFLFLKMYGSTAGL